LTAIVATASLRPNNPLVAVSSSASSKNSVFRAISFSFLRSFLVRKSDHLTTEWFESQSFKACTTQAIFRPVLSPGEGRTDGRGAKEARLSGDPGQAIILSG
jgi:hypothetical protein